jgi:hypothetical protein
MPPTLEIPDSGRVLLDCDDVLLDIIPGFRPFAETRLGRRLSPGPSSFDLSTWLSIPREQTHDLIQAFNETEGSGFEVLDPIPGAVEAVRWMRAQGLELHVVTSCSALPAVRDRRFGNLEAVFGAGSFADLVCLDLGQPKFDALARHPRSLWIDDLPKNVVAGHRAGHLSCLIEGHHNRGGQDAEMEALGLPWYRDWEHLMGRVFAAPAPAEPDL